jgi:hypothetical protein
MALLALIQKTDDSNLLKSVTEAALQRIMDYARVPRGPGPRLRDGPGSGWGALARGPAAACDLR